jgi:hypothetical protein
MSNQSEEGSEENTSPDVAHNIDEAKQFLEKHNIKYSQNMKEENIIKRALEN